MVLKAATRDKVRDAVYRQDVAQGAGNYLRELNLNTLWRSCLAYRQTAGEWIRSWSESAKRCQGLSPWHSKSTLISQGMKHPIKFLISRCIIIIIFIATKPLVFYMHLIWC